MDIRSVRIKRRAVVISYENEGEEHSITSRDMPLPAFIKSVEALAPLVLEIVHLPSDYIHGLKPTGLTLVEKQDSQMVVICAAKELTDANSPFNIATPIRFLSLPKEEGSYSPPLSDKQVALIDAVIKEAKKYVKGERAQGQLPLEPEEKDEDPDDEAEVLEFDKDKAAPASEPAKPARKPRKKSP